MNDKLTMAQFYRNRGMNDTGFCLTMYHSLFGISAITCTAVFINAVAHNYVWQVSAFLSVAFWMVTLAPYSLYKKDTRVSRSERKAFKEKHQRELELRELRIRESELGLPAWDYGRIGQ